MYFCRRVQIKIIQFISFLENLIDNSIPDLFDKNCTWLIPKNINLKFYLKSRAWNVLGTNFFFDMFSIRIQINKGHREKSFCRYKKEKSKLISLPVYHSYLVLFLGSFNRTSYLIIKFNKKNKTIFTSILHNFQSTIFPFQENTFSYPTFLLFS